MPKFFYKGVDMCANTHSGYLYATNDKELDAKLLQQGIALISAKQVRSFARATLSDAQRADIYTSIARLLDAGVLLPDVLASTAQGVKNSKIHDMLIDLATQIRQGTSFSDALQKFPLLTPKAVRYVLAAGEQSEKLSSACSQIGQYYKQTDKIKKQMRTALTMPVLTLTAFMGIMILVIGAVVPKFAQLLDTFDQELPPITQWLVHISNYFTLTSGMYAAGAIFMLAGVVVYGRTNKKINALFDYIQMYTPLIGSLFALSTYAHLFQSLSLLLANGLMLPRALELIQASVDNEYVAKEVDMMRNIVLFGSSLSSAIGRNKTLTNVPALTALIKVGESSGSLPESCAQVSDELFNRLYTQLSRLTKLLQPTCIILLGAAITALMVALYAPMMSISFAV